jgi:hypothetical protein
MIDIDNVKKIELSDHFVLCFRYDIKDYDLDEINYLAEYSANIFGKENIIWLPKDIEIIAMDSKQRRYI